jgi:tRNA (guanine37-N1)-methyltransferase
VVPICGDVARKSRAYYGKCDRVVMPLPKEGHRFLEHAIRCLKQSGTVHFYTVSPEEGLFQGPVKMVKEACSRLGKKCTILKRHRVLLYGPRAWKVCIDFRVRK